MYNQELNKQRKRGCYNLDEQIKSRYWKLMVMLMVELV